MQRINLISEEKLLWLWLINGGVRGHFLKAPIKHNHWIPNENRELTLALVISIYTWAEETSSNTVIYYFRVGFPMRIVFCNYLKKIYFFKSYFGFFSFKSNWGKVHLSSESLQFYYHLGIFNHNSYLFRNLKPTRCNLRSRGISSMLPMVTIVQWLPRYMWY